MHDIYRVFNLNIGSAVPLPAYPVCINSLDEIPDVVIEYGETPSALSQPRFKGVRFQASNKEFLLRVDGVARYYVYNGKSVIITPEKGVDEDDIVVFLIGSIMGALLYQRNILALHASAIIVNGKCVIFAGPSGIGKSTIAGGFHQRGYPILADDLCAISITGGHPTVLPGFPQLKLWADVLNDMKIDSKKLKKMRHGKNLEKYFYPVDYQEAPVPVKSIFILGTTANSDKVKITDLRGGEKLDPIIENTYRYRFLEGLGEKKDHFRQCATAAAKTAVYRVVRPKKGFQINNWMSLVEERFLA